MPVTETASSTLLSKAVGLLKRPAEYLWALFRDRTGIHIEFPATVVPSKDTWPIVANAEGNGEAGFTIVNSSSHEVQLLTVEVCFGPPLNFQPILGDDYFQGASASRDANLPFSISWKPPSSEPFILAAKYQVTLGIAAKFGDSISRDVQIVVTAANLRHGISGLESRGRVQRLKFRARVMRAQSSEVIGLPVHAHHTMLVPQAVVAKRASYFTGGPSVVEIYEIDGDGTTNSSVAYVHSTTSEAQP
jgi:hypothetical protein